MNTTSAQPLPPQPNVEQYRKLAKELAAAVKSGYPDRIAAWARPFMSRHLRLPGPPGHHLFVKAIEQSAQAFAGYWTGKLRPRHLPPPKPSLAHAQFIIAQFHGFMTWGDLVRHIESLARAD